MTAEDRQDTEGVRERLARAQFDAECHIQRGIPEKWENLPSGNQQHRLRWADAILADPSLVVLRVEDVEQVGYRVRDDGPVSTRGAFRHWRDSTTEPVFRINGWSR